MVFDDTVPVFDENAFIVCDWSEFYPDAEEAIPHNVPTPRGHGVVTSIFVDSDHAGCKDTLRSHTGIFVFVMGVSGYGGHGVRGHGVLLVKLYCS